MGPGVRRSVRGAPRLAERLAEERPLAELFRDLATLRVDRSLLRRPEDLRWEGPTAAFEEVAGLLGVAGLASRARALADRRPTRGAEEP